MLTDGGCDYTGSLCLCLGNDKFAHDAAVIIIQMADRFIQKYKVERLAECPDKGIPKTVNQEVVESEG